MGATKVLKEQSSEKCNVFLYFSVITVNLATFSLGGAYAWSSPAIPRLNGLIDSENNPLPENLTPNEESWIASLVPLAAAISAFISGYLSDKIGRKNTMLVSNIPTIAGFTLLTFGNTVAYFYAGRFLCGLGCGTVFTVIPIYVAEISENNNRGTLGCLFMFMLAMGMLVMYCIAPCVSLKVLSATNLIPPITFLIIFGIFIPESPYYYVAKKKISLAEEALLKLRRNNTEVAKRELSVIIKSVEESFAKKIKIKELSKDKAIVKAFGISLGLVCFQQWSAINTVFFYMQSIYEATGSGISSDICVIIAGIVQFVGSAFTLPLVDRFGRRVLLLGSATGNALSLFSSGIYFYLLQNTTVQVDLISWLPVLTLNLFVISYVLGFGPVTFAMIGELFPPHIKSMAATVSIFVCLLSTFCITNLFPYLEGFMGMGLTFCLLGFVCTASGIFVYMKVPETKGKSLQEVQELLRLESKART